MVGAYSSHLLTEQGQDQRQLTEATGLEKKFSLATLSYTAQVGEFPKSLLFKQLFPFSLRLVLSNQASHKQQTWKEQVATIEQQLQLCFQFS